MWQAEADVAALLVALARRHQDAAAAASGRGARGAAAAKRARAEAERVAAWLGQQEAELAGRMGHAVAFSEGQRAAITTAVTAPAAILTGGPGCDAAERGGPGTRGRRWERRGGGRPAANPSNPPSPAPSPRSSPHLSRPPTLPPRCGKTFATRAVVHYWAAQGKAVAIAAPTGRAAQRLQEIVGLPGVEASTIHRRGAGGGRALEPCGRLPAPPQPFPRSSVSRTLPLTPGPVPTPPSPPKHRLLGYKGRHDKAAAALAGGPDAPGPLAGPDEAPAGGGGYGEAADVAEELELSNACTYGKGVSLSPAAGHPPGHLGVLGNAAARPQAGPERRGPRVAFDAL
jgi:hypothetical protein